MIHSRKAPWTQRCLTAIRGWLECQASRAQHALHRPNQAAELDQQAVSHRLIASAERDRKWLAMEMHDGLGQYLLRMKNLASIGAKQQDACPSIVRKFDEISMLASKAIDEVRNISTGLRPEELDRFGFTQALLAMVETSSGAVNTRFIMEIDDIDKLLPPEQEINLFRVVQESVNNILKHSNARCAWIEIMRKPAAIELTIWDDGIGFDSSRMAKTIPFELGFGLSNMKERVKILGGELKVIAKVNEGTILRVVIPLAPVETPRTREVRAEVGVYGETAAAKNSAP
jgi:two-component system, sensor histidine kinase LadS